MVQETHYKPGKRTEATRRAQRLPAYGRRLKAALDRGMKPRRGSGGIVVTTRWDYARAFDPARVVCPPGDPLDGYDFRFLRGRDVVVLVPAADEICGEELRAVISDAGASLVVLVVNREDES